MRAVLLALLVAGVGWASSASADPEGDTTRTYAGITCVWPASTSEGFAYCGRADGVGFLIAVGHQFVFVKRIQSTKFVFFRNQPTHSAGFAPFHDKRVFHSETHRGIVCVWSRVGGGTAFCNRADNHGFLGGVSHYQAMVINEASKIVFIRNQP